MYNFDVAVKGQYRVVVNSGEREHIIPNLITDFGMNSLHNTNPATSIFRCSLGSGSTPPSFTDTLLETQIATSTTKVSTTYSNSGEAPWWQKVSVAFSFPPSTALSIRELGVFTSGGSLFSRALVVDQFGNPTTITVLPTEELVVYYELFKLIPSMDVVEDYTYSDGITNSTYQYTARSANANTTNTSGYWYPTTPLASFTKATAFNTQVLGAVTGRPLGASFQDGAITWDSYVAGSFTRTGVATFGPSVANFAEGIGCVALGGVNEAWGFQLGFSNSLLKTSNKKLTIPFRVTWGRR